jgi:heme-degrading monooxygenase HmoA
MVYEFVSCTVEPDKRDEYVERFKQAWLEAGFANSHGVTALRCVEDPAKVALLIGWDSVEAHRAHRGTDYHNLFREKIAAGRTAPSDIVHYTIEKLAD